MMKYIIVKYAEDRFPNGRAHISWAVHPESPTAVRCGIIESYFTDKEVASIALEQMTDLNPTVGYGIVKAIE